MAHRPATGDEGRAPISPAVVTETEQRPIGAMVVTLIYMALIVASWGYMYWVLLSRG